MTITTPQGVSTVPSLGSPQVTAASMAKIVSGVADSYLNAVASTQILPEAIVQDPSLRAAYAAFSMKASMVMASYVQIEKHPIASTRFQRRPLYFATALLKDPPTSDRWAQLSTKKQDAFYRLLFDAAVTHDLYREVTEQLFGADMANEIFLGAAILSETGPRTWVQETLAYAANHFSIEDAKRLLAISRPNFNDPHVFFHHHDRMGYQHFEEMFQAVIDAPAERLEEQLTKYFTSYLSLRHILPLTSSDDVVV